MPQPIDADRPPTTNAAAAPPELSLVIPLYQEQASLAALLPALETALAGVTDSWELIFVDDGSTDGTWETVMELQQHAHLTLRALRFNRNFGKEAAITAGLENARGRAVVVMDADLQHPPSLLPQMIRVWREGTIKVVEAVKTDRGKESALSRLQSAAFYRILHTLSGYDLAGHTDYKLLDREVVDAWLALDERNRFFRGLVAWLGYPTATLPFAVPERATGGSRWSWTGLFGFALTAVTSFTTRPIYLATTAGLVFAVIAFFLALQTLFNWASGGAVTGFTTVILLLLIIGSIVLLSLGVIGEYIARIYIETKKRPLYTLRESTHTHTPQAGGDD